MMFALCFLTLVGSISAQEQPAKPFVYKYVEWTYLNDESKIQRTGKNVELDAAELRLVPARGKPKPETTVTIPYASIKTIEYSAATSGSLAIGFGISTDSRERWLKITGADGTYWLLKLRADREVKHQMLLAELERRSKITIGPAK
jgi:hypothetical protein